MDEPQRKIALITGASSGIGAEFARQLAAAGYDLILVARRESRLKALAATLSQEHNVHVQWLTADLATEAGIAAVTAYITGLPRLDLLVNNAGFGTGGAFAEADVAEQAAMLNLHMMAPMRLSHAALPGMIARRSGGIINVASLAGFMALPGSANYCATKAYLATFSQAVAAEVRRHGVRVQALCPGFTVTEFHDRPDQGGFDRSRIPRFAWGSARAVVADSLRGLARGQIVCVPGFLNRLILLLARVGLVNRLAPAFLGRNL
ncbi:MAG: SDR family oxidoreductase [Anaerolineae bacterium]|nr:SDR family oxidoreductase [Anaerolineae bacterium]